MKTLRLVLGDQLSRPISSLSGLDPNHDIVLMVEVHDETTYVRHHKQKIVLVLAAMRHFAQELQDEGISVDYILLDNELNSCSFTGEVARALQRHAVDQIVVTEPSEWRVLEMMQTWEGQFNIPVEIRPDDRFLATHERFEKWTKGRKTLTMEYFYREMRRETGWLMEGNDPVGGEWNYDAQNRKKIPKGLELPKRERFEPDAITQDVIELVANRFSGHFGDLDQFGWAVTRGDALEALDYFINVCLPDFGNYQDAMQTDEAFLFHSVISPYINIGLLRPAEVCEAAVAAYHTGSAPIQAVEGFVRQILGWREYVRGIYWLKMPEYKQTNFLKANRPLPDFYWTGETDMHCLADAIKTTKQNAYAHHIQRLMITGNFALLTGIDPEFVNEWYMIVYADAFEWVELPNTHGMALHADGGVLGSKPYA
ncbi:MAG: cryptochrome/photolyase family protein, partial [Chloroflexota bacterium]